MNKSHRDIKGETLTDYQKKELLKRKAEQIEKRALQKRIHSSPEIKPSKKYFRNMKLKKIGNWLLTTLAAENAIGQSLHGVLDNFPGPNQIVAKWIGSKIHPEKREEEKQKMWSKRNIVALMFFVVIIFLLATGRVDEAISLLK